MYLGWELPHDDREVLLKAFPPTHPKIIAHHVTLQYPAEPDAVLPVQTYGEVVGVADNDGVQALIVKISRTTKRPDGGTYHITWSLEKSRKPVDSNCVISKYGFEPTEPIFIFLTPKLFE